MIGGIKRISDVAGKLVPVMTVGYLGAGMVVLGLNVSAIPDAFTLIIKSAFTPVAAQGGFAGAVYAPYSQRVGGW
ncbi:hypothetical protein XCR1_860019 [Xenorhabdus cabanillasii JM26]|uniref:Uncharacterized protein n=1 Tax=Xenorhabdus cabanillasii JM26 TaxID=1427517 RepID=W1JC65_9GAMM|nr:hypothetical protein XCR1_860019 [Xenorhabdus cabanillasii JM26]